MEGRNEGTVSPDSGKAISNGQGGSISAPQRGYVDNNVIFGVFVAAK